MSSSPEQSGSATPNPATPNSTPLNISRGLSDASMISSVSYTPGSGGESPPHPYHGQTLSPPQLSNVVGASPSSTPNSPYPSRPSSGSLVKGMKRKFGRKAAGISPQTVPPTVQEDSLLGADHQANKALFIRMLKSWQLQPKKMKHFRRGKRRADKQYHSDDGYTSDPGILREEEDDETDNDPDELRRRLGNMHEEERKQEKMLELERKADKIRRSLEEDDSSLHENGEEDLESMSDKPREHRSVVFRLYRNSAKSKSFHDNQRAKLEKIEAQLKELREGGGVDSRGARIRGRIEGGLRGMSLGIKGLGKLRKRKRLSGRSPDGDGEGDGEVIMDDEEDEDEDVPGADVIITETSPEHEDIVALKVDLAALRLATEQAFEDNKKWREDTVEQNERFGVSLTLLMEKLDQERERGDRLEGQLNDITELHQHEVGNLRTQLAQIEHTTTSRCQDFEDAVDEFQSKFTNLDAHMQKLQMDTGATGEGPPVNHLMRKIAASFLSLLLLIFALLLKLTSIVRGKPRLVVPIAVVLVAVVLYLLMA